MARIFITGNAGAGKSTFSKRLALLCGMEAHSLDTLFWNRSWKPVPKEERLRVIRELTAPGA
jgi:adenylate kinase family enzyme